MPLGARPCPGAETHWEAGRGPPTWTSAPCERALCQSPWVVSSRFPRLRAATVQGGHRRTPDPRVS